MVGGNAGSEAFGRLGVWVNGNFHLGEVDSTPNLLGFNYKNWGVTLGSDYKLTEKFLFGGAFSYILSDSDFDHRSGHLDTDSYIGSLYGSYYPFENFYVDGIVHYGHINYDLIRDLDLAMPQDPGRNLAKSDTDGRLWGFTATAGYHLQHGGLTFTPYVRASYRRLIVDGYRETSNLPLLRLEVGEQHVRSLQSVVGGQVSYAISLPWGVLTPQFRGEWHHEFRDPSRTIATRFTEDVLSRVVPIKVPAPDRDFAIFGTDVTATFAHEVSAFVGYEALVGYQHISSHRIMGGVRVQF